jgi:3-deoxy-D-arabino-heptulosonate 7-phosphate (DAHP) synthase
MIIEVHPAPEKAISDGAQSLDIPQFQEILTGRPTDIIRLLRHPE